MVDPALYDTLLRAFLPQRYSLTATVIEFLGIIVAFMISYLGFKAYKLTKEKKYQYFSWGFLLLAFNFLSHVVLNVLVNFNFVEFFVENKFRPFIIPLFGVYYFFLMAALLAYISFAIVYADIKHSKKIWLFYFWGLVIGAYTFRDRVIFNIVSAIPLSFVASLAYDKFKETKNKNQFYTVFAFVCLFLFHVLTIFDIQDKSIYIIKYIILLVGLVSLLTPLLKIFYGRKKK